MRVFAIVIHRRKFSLCGIVKQNKRIQPVNDNHKISILQTFMKSASDSYHILNLIGFVNTGDFKNNSSLILNIHRML